MGWILGVVIVCWWGLDGEVSSAESSSGTSGSCRGRRIWLFPFHYVLLDVQCCCLDVLRSG